MNLIKKNNSNSDIVDTILSDISLKTRTKRNGFTLFREQIPYDGVIFIIEYQSLESGLLM